MEWKNANKDGLPDDNQEVLISVDGINHIAVFNASRQDFKAKRTFRTYSVKSFTIYWMEIPGTDQ